MDTAQNSRNNERDKQNMLCQKMSIHQHNHHTYIPITNKSYKAYIPNLAPFLFYNSLPCASMPSST